MSGEDVTEWNMDEDHNAGEEEGKKMNKKPWQPSSENWGEGDKPTTGASWYDEEMRQLREQLAAERKRAEDAEYEALSWRNTAEDSTRDRVALSNSAEAWRLTAKGKEQAYVQMEQQLAAEKDEHGRITANLAMQIQKLTHKLIAARDLLFAVQPFCEAFGTAAGGLNQMGNLADDIKEFLDGKPTVQGTDQEQARGTITSELEGGKEGTEGTETVDPGAEGRSG